MGSPAWLNLVQNSDGSIGYGYQGGPDLYPPDPQQAGFYQDSNWLPLLGERRLLTLPLDAHEIFSFCAQSRTRALGAVGDATPQFAADLNLLEFGYDGTRYAHSRQFRSEVSAEQGYWGRLVDDIAVMRTWR